MTCPSWPAPPPTRVFPVAATPASAPSSQRATWLLTPAGSEFTMSADHLLGWSICHSSPCARARRGTRAVFCRHHARQRVTDAPSAAPAPSHAQADSPPHGAKLRENTQAQYRSANPPHPNKYRDAIPCRGKSSLSPAQPSRGSFSSPAVTESRANPVKTSPQPTARVTARSQSRTRQTSAADTAAPRGARKTHGRARLSHGRPINKNPSGVPDGLKASFKLLRHYRQASRARRSATHLPGRE